MLIIQAKLYMQYWTYSIDMVHVSTSFTESFHNRSEATLTGNCEGGSSILDWYSYCLCTKTVEPSSDWHGQTKFNMVFSTFIMAISISAFGNEMYYLSKYTTLSYLVYHHTLRSKFSGYGQAHSGVEIL